MMKKSVLTGMITAVVLGAFGSGSLAGNGLALTPPMGWNTFNQWGGGWTENAPVAGGVVPVLKMVADSLVSTGLRDCGYVYVNCDGANGGQGPFWPGYPGFQGWAKSNAAYMHSKGLKFGVYTSEFSNPQKIATDLAGANVDFLKVDAWTTPSSNPGWKALGDALVASGYPVVYSTHSSIPSESNLWRTGGDIFPSWPRVMDDYDANYSNLTKVVPGSWADPDMMEVGCRPFAKDILFTYDENRAHFSMWCMMAAPLLIGFDVTRTHVLNAAPLDEYVKTLAIFSNTEVIAVDQDSLGKPGKRVKGQGALEVWTKEMKDGSRAVAFFNRTGSAASMSITQAELGLGTGTIYVRDLWQHTNLPNFSSGSFSATVASHAAEIYKMSTTQFTAVAELRKMDRSIAWLKQNGYEVFPQRLVPGVLAGGDPRARFFDLRGRTLAVGPMSAGPYYVRGIAGSSGTVPFVWPSGAAHNSR